MTIGWLGREVPLGSGTVVVPNIVARSSLFSSRPTHIVSAIKDCPERLHSWGKVAIVQTAGLRLAQGDATVWLSVVASVMREAPPTSSRYAFEFAPSQLLKGVGLVNDSKHRKALQSSLKRLSSAVFKFSMPDGHTFETKLLDVRGDDELRGRRYRIQVSDEVPKLFVPGWSYLKMQHRQSLSHNPLAQWLLGHYVTHRTPLPIGQAKLKYLTDRGAMRDDKWAGALGHALSELESVTGWSCQLSSKGVVTVEKNPQPLHDNISTPKDDEIGRTGLTHCDDLPEPEQLIDAWLLSMNYARLVQELTWLDARPSNLVMLQAPDLRRLVRDVLRGRPLQWERQVEKLIKKQFE